MNECATTFNVSAENWQFFATLSLTNRLLRVRDDVRQALIIGHLRKIARTLPVIDQGGRAVSRSRSMRNLLFTVREELGEKTGRLHFHYLLAGLDPGTALRKGTAFFIKHDWEKRTRGAMARVYRYDPSLPGVAYILKNSGKDLKAALSYEVGKFQGERGRRVMFSEGFVRKWRALRIEETRERAAGRVYATGLRGNSNRNGRGCQGGSIGEYSLRSSGR